MNLKAESELLCAIDRHARRAGAGIALEGDTFSLTYIQLVEQIDRLAAQLRERKIRRLALQADNSPLWALIDLACQQAGIVLVPLPGFFSPAQLAHSLGNSGCDAALSEGPALSEHVESLGGLPGFVLSRFDIPEKAAPPLPAGTVKLTYTSGSTGQPKGVCLSLVEQLQAASAINCALSSCQLRRHLSILPLATLLENVAGVYATLFRGGSVLLPSLTRLGWRGSSTLDAVALCQVLEVSGADSAIILPHLLTALTDRLAMGWQAPSSLRFVAVGGARSAASQLSRARHLGLPVYEGYGLSECGSVVTLNVPGSDRLGSAGRVLDHCRVTAENGWIRVAGNSFLGYLGHGDERVEDSVGIDTGDLGEIDDDGFLWLKGRRKNLLISAFGRNISPEWVESELLAQPIIEQCMVVGDGQPYCAALVFPKPGVSAGQLRHAVEVCNSGLPDYAQLRQWRCISDPFTHANGFLTANGRPRREAILQHYADVIASCYITASSTTQLMGT